MSKPVDILSFKNHSMLDTIFVSRLTKKPSWITITTGSETTLFSVSTVGHLHEEAVIDWSGDERGKPKKGVTIKIGDETYPAERFGQRDSGIFTNPKYEATRSFISHQ
jgi:hypothetical protein